MILQSFKMAWKAISSNKMRSFLTMLGIIIGVFALVVLVSLVSGATTSVTDTISSLGTNMLSVTISDDKGKPYKLDDLTEIAEDPEIDQVAAIGQSSMTASNSSTEETATVYGTTSAYQSIQGLELEHGRWLKTVDVTNHTYVAVISASTAEDILGSTDVVGESIKLDGMAFEIIGVLVDDDEDSSSALLGSSYDIYIPYTTLVRLSNSVSTSITTFYASATSDDTLDDAESALETILLERFEDDEDAYTIYNQSTIMDAMSSITGTLSLLLGGIAAISLLVGGIGIMNIMLVSVTERTREIGIRKAIGASRGSIMTQFLIEALVVSLMGCCIGIGLSWVAIQIVNQVGGTSYGLAGNVVIIAVVFSLLVGLVFGLYPANKAAKKKPIDALRYTG
ncbi:MAG: ABC transporter permease [Clostridiales bacterium]|nr:ABC transporter permease [Clostridiales bacterium]